MEMEKVELKKILKPFKKIFNIDFRANKEKLQEYYNIIQERKVINQQIEENYELKTTSYVNELQMLMDDLVNERIYEIEVDLTKINFKDLIVNVKDYLISDKQIIIKVGNKIYTLSDKFIERLENFEINGSNNNQNGSDLEFFINTYQYKTATIELLDVVGNVRPAGGFFNYYNKTHFDFSKYGIFKKENNPDYKNNCLYIALKEGGMSNEKLNKFKTFVINRVVPINKLKKVCEELNITINLKRRISNKTKLQKYGDNNEEVYNINLIEEHYFINEMTNITSYCIKNYNKVKNIENCNELIKKNKKSTERFIESFKLVELLLENKNDVLEKIPTIDLQKTQYSKDFDEFETLEYDENSYKLNELKINEKYNNYYLVFFDFETFTDKKNKNIHIPYCVCYITEDGDENYFYGENCGYKMLNDLKKFNKDIMLIAHNAKYDYLFLSKYLFCEKPLLKDGNFYISEARFYYEKKNYYSVCVKDSFKLISMPLKKFGKCFNLNIEKEVMPYNVYNERNPIKDRFKDLNKCLSYLPEKDHQQFITNCEKFDVIKNNKVDIINYSRKYCEIDCKVLREGYMIFRQWMWEITNIDINNIITIASLAHKYLLQEGVYDDVYQLSGIPRAFIQKAIVGGRVMCSNNEKKIYDNGKKIADYDACSLYPSAMNRLGDIGGYLKGLPKILQEEQLNMDFLNKQDGYFLKIKITKINKHFSFPLLSELKDGIRNFSNELEGNEIYIDKISLEDCIEFQNIEFEIIQGYYFNEGRNNTIKNVINFLYDERKKKKAEENPIQECYKLIMNSAYGKTILKPTDTSCEIVFVNNFEKYISFNYNNIKELIKISEDKYFVEKYNPISNQFNMCQVGCEVLSMSKRIMNEVMCLAENNNIELFYQDTDSMHLYYDDVEKLEKLYFNKYNRELNGKNMGQFHIDFDLNGADSEIYSTKSIFLGKKCYIDCLECINKNGSIVNGYHIRMKGVNSESILFKSNNLNVSPFELYENLYSGSEIEFDLTCGGNKACFEFNKMQNVSSKSEFIRKLKF